MARPRPHAPAADGPAEGDTVIGFDESPDMRPGVPRETAPRPAEGSHWTAPQRQTARRGHLHREGLDRLTPVFGTANPPRGVSGVVRRLAYRIPEHRARHWALLLAADRADVADSKASASPSKPIPFVRSPLPALSPSAWPSCSDARSIEPAPHGALRPASRPSRSP